MNANREQKTRAAMQFSGWLKRFAPDMHAAVMSRVGEAPANGALNQLGESWDMLGQFFPGEDAMIQASRTTTTTTNGTTQSEAWYTGVLDFAKEAIPAYLAYDAQKDIMDMNIERAKQGLPPIDPGVTAPQVKVVHDFPPATQAAISDWKNTAIRFALWGGIGLAAFFVLRRIM